jgi:hypothetical protein
MARPRPGWGQDVAAIAYLSHSPAKSLMVARRPLSKQAAKNYRSF